MTDPVTTLPALDAALRARHPTWLADTAARTFARVMLAHGAAVTVEPCPGNPGGARVRSDRGPVVDLDSDGRVIVAYCGDEPAEAIDAACAVMGQGARR